jgi:tetrahydromethanopterin S-methyltransferase subunit B
MKMNLIIDARTGQVVGAATNYVVVDIMKLTTEQLSDLSMGTKGQRDVVLCEFAKPVGE